MSSRVDIGVKEMVSSEVGEQIEETVSFEVGMTESRRLYPLNSRINPSMHGGVKNS